MQRDNNEYSDFVLTFDLDWAPDYAINFVVDFLIEKNVKSTWFITHHSDAIEKLKRYPDLFELALHPNFLSTSTHGKTETEVMNKIIEIVGSSKVVRTHCLVQSSRLMIKMIKDYNIKIDCSLFLPKTPNIQPHFIHYGNNTSILRIPYFWEDDEECFDPNKSWDFNNLKYHVNGLKVFNFHPTFIFLNSNDLSEYEKLKSEGVLNTIPLEIAKKYVNESTNGVKKIFIDFVNFLSNRNLVSLTISELAFKHFNHEYKNFG